MLFSSLFARLTRGTKPNLKSGARRRVSSCRKRSFQPTLEALEDRTLLSAGMLNPHFGTGGKTLINFGATNTIPGILTPNFVVQPDGTTVLAGLSTNSKTGQIDWAVAELTKHGNLNPHFGTGGETIIAPPSNIQVIYYPPNIAVRPDGTIVLEAGDARNIGSPGSDLVVAELNKDGSLNHGFGNGGEIFISQPAGYAINGGTNFVIKPDGSIVLFTGIQAVAAPSPFTYMFAELTKDGNLNTDFGTGGETILADNIFADNTDFVNAHLAIACDGTLVLTGDVSTGGAVFSGIGVVELTRDGSLNDSFGQGGKMLVKAGPNLLDLLTNAVVNQDSTIFLGDTPYNPSDFTIGYFGVIKLSKDGSLDANFGVGGETLIFGPTASYNNAYMNSIAVAPNGAIVLGGTVTSISTGQNELAVAELTRDGRLKTDFGVGGESITDFGPNYSIPAGFFLGGGGNIVVQPDGTIALATAVTNVTTGQNDYAVAEFTKEGSLNPTFGTSGETIVDFGAGNPATLSYAIVEPDGTIVLAGVSTNSTTRQVSWAVAELSGSHSGHEDRD